MTRTEIRVAGLRVTRLKKEEVLREIGMALGRPGLTRVFTPYSEFLYRSVRDQSIRDSLNQGDFMVADGIGVMWAACFLQRSLGSSRWGVRTLRAVWQVVYTGVAILLRPSFVRRIIPEKIVGADLVWDLAAMASHRGMKLLLLGGFGDTPAAVALKIRQRFPGMEVISSNLNPEDTEAIMRLINDEQPHMVFVAFGPIRQERWINEYLSTTSVKLAVGVGGTFDYIAGIRSVPPRWIRQSGLEWLYRLLTQPFRWRRIWQATAGLVFEITRYKIRLPHESKH